MKWLRRLLAGAAFVGLLVGGWLFADRNGDLVRVDYLVGELGDIPFWKTLIAASLLGAIASALVMSFVLVRSLLESRRYRKAVVKLESEVHQLRNLPLVTDEPPIASAQARNVTGAAAGRSE
jgi:uncharacterized integral membrane protein